MTPPVRATVWHTVVVVAGVAALHLVLTVCVVFASMGAVVSGMDGGPVASPGGTRALGLASDVLTFPLLSPWSSVPRAPISRAPVIAILFVNSVLWSAALLAIGRTLPRRAPAD